MDSAVCHGDLTTIDSLISAGYPLDRRLDFQGMTPLLQAATCNQPGAVARLLEKGAQVDHPKNSPMAASGRSALSFAAERGYLDVATVLLDHGANPNARDVNGDTPLHRAAQAAQLQALDLLIARGATVNAKDNMRATPLMLGAAARSDSAARCIRALLEHGAQPNSRTKRNQTALEWALYSGTPEVVRLLLYGGAQDDNALAAARRRGDPAITSVVEAACRLTNCD
jgi:cytohesin